MANKIHPSATVGKKAKLGDNNEIGPGCLIDDGVVLGSNNTLWMNVYLGPGTTIGDRNRIHMGAVIGHEPQDVSFSGEPSFTKVGSGNVIREYVTIHRGTKPGSETVLGDENYLMANAHMGHNCRVGNKAVLVNLATLAGHCVVEDGAILSGMVVVHQFCRIGRLAMISGLSAVNKDVPPYLMCGGRPAVIQGLNAVGLRRSGLSAGARAAIKRAYALLYRSGLNVAQAVKAIKDECEGPEVAAFLKFVEESKRGLSAGIGSEDAEEESLLPKKPPQGAELAPD
jgi:UDP-N-acetylglucosamine acyltransferase